MTIIRSQSGLSVAMLLLCASGLAPRAAAAADNWQVEGANGVLHVHGVLTESACRLEMSSAEQSVSLGNTGSGRLQQAGDRGEPVLSSCGCATASAPTAAAGTSAAAY
ncbi:Uncharacterised protein [Serratia rubidaea]|uniref:Uncharacterized protein n=1 Tax=Serratia rubidaea TaxID=61652 RepID=A0A4U9HKI7_SERRU|nr:Uncharacterised protein [Serratia rubidaea]